MSFMFFFVSYKTQIKVINNANPYVFISKASDLSSYNQIIGLIKSYICNMSTGYKIDNQDGVYYITLRYK